MSAALMAACGDHQSVHEASPGVDAKEGSCGAGSFLEAEIYGAIRASLRWGEQLVCDGMPRPDGAGARLHFAGFTARDGQQPLSLILGLPGLTRGATASEIPTNVTVIAEDQGRFFSTPDTSSCWTDISSQELLVADGDRYRISGILYCVAALAEVNGDSSITLGDMNFSGVLDWNPPQ